MGARGTSPYTTSQFIALAVEFHYELVRIHAFPNGNGRHARFCADRLAENLRKPAFSWGAAALRQVGRARTRYLECLQQADAGEMAPLVAFARADYV